MLVTAELELMEVSRLCAIYQGIPVAESLPGPLDLSLPLKVYQWRVLLFLQELHDLSFAEVLQAGHDPANLYIHARLLDSVTTWRLYLD